MRYYLSIIATLITLSLSAQDLPERGLVRSGNRKFKREDYKAAIEKYDKAKEITPEKFEVLYNYGSALYFDEQYERAEAEFKAAAADSLLADRERADLMFNLGNSQFKQEKYQEALESYKSTMRIDPDDQDVKFNYALTKKLLEQQQDQDQDQDQDQNEDQQDQDQDQNEDQQDQDQNEDQGDNEQEQQEQPQDQDEQESEGEQQPQEGRISPQEQQQMLDAIQAQEDKTQEKLEEEGKAILIPGSKNW